MASCISGEIVTLRDRTLPKLDAARAKVAALGLRQVTVVVRTRTYSDPVGAVGATVTATTNVTVTPTPRVSPDRNNRGDEVILDGEFADATAAPHVLRWVVGPMTPEYGEGGYDSRSFLPDDSTNKRVTIVLSGGQFGAGEEFRAVRVDDTRALRFTVTVERTRQGA